MRLKRIIRKGVAGLSLLFLMAAMGSQIVSAADYYVSISNGNDAAGDGSAASPWKTFHYAVGRLAATDILHVGPGYYSIAGGEADSALDVTAADVTIQGDGPGAIIDGAGAIDWMDGLRIVSVSNVRVSGLSFIHFGNAGVFLQNLPGLCYVTDCRFSESGIGIQLSNADPILERNRFYNNTVGVSVMGVSGFLPASPEIRNNLIVAQGGMQYGIKITAVTVDILAPAVASPLVHHNTIDGGAGIGIYIDKDPDSTAAPDIRFNIITNFSQYGVQNINASPVFFDYNNVWNHGISNYSGISPGAHDISSDPLFLMDGEKYYLQAVSPCINLIPNNADPVTEDLRKAGRPSGSQIDPGCFEIIEPVIVPGTYYVDVVNGSNQLTSGASPGSGAFRNLHYALDRINTGNPGNYSLHVADGTYSVSNGEDNEWMEVNRNNLTIQGPAEPLSAFVDGAGGIRWACGLAINAQDVTVGNLKFQHFSRGGIIIVNSSPLVRQNQFIANNIGIIVESDSSAASPVIINNLFWGGVANAMASGITLRTSVTAAPYIYFNTMDNGSDSGVIIESNGGTATPDIQCNIITNFGQYGIQNIGGSFIPEYNNLYNNVTADYSGVSPGINDISVQPFYVGPLDHHLQSGSTCIDGIPNSTSFPAALISDIGQDLDGNVRPSPSGGGYDMGCYENTSSVTVGISITPAGSGSVTDDHSQIDCPGVCTGSYSPSDTISLLATPGTGYRLDHWEEGGQTVSTANPMTFTLNTNHAVTAVFTLSHTAGDYYVNINTGDDAAGDGSSAAPWKTFHHAVSQLISSDTLHMAPGSYTIANGEADEPLEINTSSLTIQGDGQGVIIDGSGAAVWTEGLRINAQQYVRIAGLDFMHFGSVAVVFQDLTGKCVITGCNLSDNAIGIQALNSDPDITMNRLFNNVYGIFVMAEAGSGGGAPQASPEIWNNLITAQGGMQYGIKVEAMTTDAGAAPSIYHNTIDGGSEAGIFIYTSTGVAAPDIRFNIITSFSQYGISNTGGTPASVDYNDVWNNGADNYSGVSPGANDISADPLYLSDGEKYYLQSGSPCINQIPANAHPVTEDLRGTTRPLGALIDMGCFEIAETVIRPGTYYVDVVNGSNQAEGGTSPGAGAFRNLHYAMNLINSGDPGIYTLNVASGIYSVANGEDDNLLEVKKNDLFIQGSPEPPGAVIDGLGGLRWTDGMTINTQGITVTGLVFRNFSRGGIAVVDSSPLLHRNHFIDNNSGVFITAENAEASPAIINNLFQGEAANGMGSGIVLNSISAGAGTNPLIYFNTMDNGADSGVVIENSGVSASPEIKCNIITGFGKYGILNSGGSPVLDYNDLHGNMSADYVGLGPGANDISASPLYLSSSDHHLQSDSICIDAVPNTMVFPGSLIPVMGQDLEGNVRPIPAGGGYDMGCYEQSSSMVVTVSIVISPEGAGTVTDDQSQINCPGDCNGGYSASDTITLLATPNAGYVFDHWEEGAGSHPENPLTFTVNAGQSGTAVFVQTGGGNQPPNTPIPVKPQEGEFLASDITAVTLVAGDYSDPENDSHTETYWQVRRQDRGVYNCDDYDPSFSSVDSEAPGLTTHIVKGLEPGMQYVWKVGYKDAGSKGIAWSRETVFTVGDTAVDREVNIPAGVNQMDYRMVSFPVWPENSDCLSAFRNSFTDGLYDTRYVRLGTYNPILGGYAECSDNLIIRPGRAYWMLVREGLRVNLGGVPVTRQLDLEVPLAYEPVSQDGWNMVACPNLAGYNWADMEVIEADGEGGVIFGPEPISMLGADNPYIDLRLWRWENGAYADDTTIMRPYTGYWVKARKADLFLKFPESAQQAMTSLLSVTAQADGNKMQTATQNTDEDKQDSPPPPMGASFTVKSDGLSAKGACFMESMMKNRD